MTEAQIRQQHTAYPALVKELKKLGLLGADGQPVREAWFSAHQLAAGPLGRKALEVHLVPLADADPAQVESALKLCREWSWGPPKPPRVSLAEPYRDPEEPGED